MIGRCRLILEAHLPCRAVKAIAEGMEVSLYVHDNKQSIWVLFATL